MKFAADRYLTFILSCLLIVFAVPGQSTGIFALTDSILSTTGLSRNTFNIIYMFSTMTGCLLVLASGSIVGNFKLKKASIIALSIFVFMFFCGWHYSSLEKLLCGGILSAALYNVIFFYIWLSIMRFFGQNMLPMLGKMRIVRDFDKKQGIAIAINGVFISISTGLAPRVINFLSNGVDWQRAYKMLFFAGIALLIIYSFLMKDSPAIDGNADKLADVATDKKNLEISRRKLLRMPIFWCIILPLCLNQFIGSGMTINIVDIFRENGLSPKAAINSHIYLCCSTVIAGLLFGRQLDKNGLKSCIFVLLLLQLVGLIGIEFVDNIFGFCCYVIGIGSTWGAYGVLMTASWAKIFGGQSLARVLSLVYFSATIVGALSAPLISFSRSFFGSYFCFMRGVECVIIFAMILVVLKFPKNLQRTDY